MSRRGGIRHIDKSLLDENEQDELVNSLKHDLVRYHSLFTRLFAFIECLGALILLCVVPSQRMWPLSNPLLSTLLTWVLLLSLFVIGLATLFLPRWGYSRYVWLPSFSFAIVAFCSALWEYNSVRCMCSVFIVLAVSIRAWLHRDYNRSCRGITRLESLKYKYKAV